MCLSAGGILPRVLARTLALLLRLILGEGLLAVLGFGGLALLILLLAILGLTLALPLTLSPALLALLRLLLGLLWRLLLRLAPALLLALLGGLLL